MSLSIQAVSAQSAASLPTLHFSKEELENRLIAVHATRHLPEGHKIKAALFDATNIVPDIRSTLHFALGELVRPVDGVMSWEDCPYAILCPLKTLTPQLININCYDTFILGDLEFNETFTVILPEGTAHNIPHFVKILFYDSVKESLREATDRCIAAQDGWHIRMSEEDHEDELAEAMLEGRNINTIDVFSILQAHYPGLSIGCRFDKISGDAHLLGNLENMVYALALYYFRPNTITDVIIPLESLEEQFQQLKAQLHQVIAYASALHITPEKIAQYLQKLKSLDCFLELIEIDLNLKKTHHKTLAKSDPKIIEEILANPENIKDIVAKNFELLAEDSTEKV